MSGYVGYTPGPWYADDNEIYKNYGDERVLIATANIKWEECMYNAELIAAAPELLAKCDRLREALRDLVEESAPLLSNGSYELKQAKAALQEGRG